MAPAFPPWQPALPNSLDTLARLIRNSRDMKTPIPPVLITFAFVCVVLLQNAQAVVPAPDGGYPGFTTAEGTKALQNLTTGSANTAVGWFSLESVTTGSFNSATGAGSLLFNTAEANTAFGAAALLFNTTGTNSTAVGAAALLDNTIGEENTATGAFALSSNTEGDFNTANGAFALQVNTMGERNTAIGDSAMFSNTTGSRNTATGNAALGVNTTGVDNTAIGSAALFFNNGDDNTAIGSEALLANTTGFNNTADGYQALQSNTEGSFNTAVGFRALNDNILGGQNTALGYFAGFNVTGTNNTAVGGNALFNSTTGNGNMALGAFSGGGITTANNVICIGAAGVNLDNSCFIANIYSNVQPIVGTDPDSVTITSNGRLGRGNVSSRRYKHDIQPMDNASEALYALKPVRFCYNKEYDATQTLAFGLIAEEVAEVYPDLVGRNREGQPESVRYEQVNAMLLNEFLKTHRVVQKQRATITRLISMVENQEAANAKQQKQIDGLTAGLQKVSGQLETSKFATERIRHGGPAPHVVNNP